MTVATRRRVDKRRPDTQTTAPRSLATRPRYGDCVANTRSAEKAARQAEKHRARNVALRSRMRTAARGVTTAVAGGNKEAAKTSYRHAVPVIDSAVSKQTMQ